MRSCGRGRRRRHYRGVARVFAGRGVPMAIVPLGTANNTALSLGIEAPIDELMSGWRPAGKRPLDLGIAQTLGATTLPRECRCRLDTGRHRRGGGVATSRRFASSVDPGPHSADYRDALSACNRSNAP